MCIRDSNEVAPCQHELAPVYSELNASVDNNLLMMEKMKLIASRHDLVCLLHEKPFEGINGSGKHLSLIHIYGRRRGGEHR